MLSEKLGTMISERTDAPTRPDNRSSNKASQRPSHQNQPLNQCKKHAAQNRPVLASEFCAKCILTQTCFSECLNGLLDTQKVLLRLSACHRVRYSCSELAKLLNSSHLHVHAHFTGALAADTTRGGVADSGAKYHGRTFTWSTCITVLSNPDGTCLRPHMLKASTRHPGPRKYMHEHHPQVRT